MASGIIILHHWNRQVRNIMTCIGALKKQYSSEAIHDLRVSVKKLRSYLDAIQSFNRALDYKSEFSATASLFKLLGRHRDLQVGLAMVKAFENKNNIQLQFFCDVLQNAIERSNEGLRRPIAEFDENTLTSLTLKLQDALNGVNSNEFSQWMIASIKTNYESSKRRISHFGHHIHDIRKSLKNILYHADMLPAEKTKALLPISKTRKIVDHLGEWHDHEMLVDKIKHFRKDFITSAMHESILLKKFEKDMVTKKEELVERCRQVFNQQ